VGVRVYEVLLTAAMCGLLSYARGMTQFGSPMTSGTGRPGGAAVHAVWPAHPDHSLPSRGC
jgi:hypothetical protein